MQGFATYDHWATRIPDEDESCDTPRCYAPTEIWWGGRPLCVTHLVAMVSDSQLTAVAHQDGSRMGAMVKGEDADALAAAVEWAERNRRQYRISVIFELEGQA